MGKLVMLLGLTSWLVPACKPAEVYAIWGRVSGSWQCINAGSSRMPTMIRLQPLDWTAPFSHAEPEFSFRGVRAGEYTLEVSCAGMGGPFPEMAVTIATADVEVEVVLPFPNLPKREPISTLAGHRGRVLSVAFSPDSVVLASAAEDGTVIRWDVTTGEQAQTLFHGHTDATLPLVLSSDSTLLASGGSDGTVRLWDAVHEDLLHTWRDLDGRPGGMAFSLDGSTVAAWEAGDKDRARVWNVFSGELLQSLNMGQDQQLPWWARKTILFLPDGATMVSVVSLNREWRLDWWEVVTGRHLRSSSPPGVEVVTLSTADSAAVSADGKLFAFGTAGIENRGSVVIWDLETDGSRTGRYAVSIDRVAFSPDGTSVASTALDNTVVLWNVSSGEAETVLVSDSRGIDAFAWSPDGRMLAAADGEGRILLWEMP
jgi:WD40 repeat protein